MNCLLLAPENFVTPYAYIKDLKQITHINDVLGLQIGGTLKIGELGGNLGTATIYKIMPDVIQLCDIQLTNVPPVKLNLTVVLALPRPKVLRRLIMDMTAIGVDNIILINSYRTQKSYWQSPMLNRLDEFVLEGLQQGVDTIRPTISLQKRFKPFVEDELTDLTNYNNSTNEPKAIVAHPRGSQSLSHYLKQSACPNNISAKIILPNIVFIGSEGGWIDYEIDLLASHGCQAVTIGQRILRTEAAVNAILGQWLLES